MPTLHENLVEFFTKKARAIQDSQAQHPNESHIPPIDWIMRSIGSILSQEEWTTKDLASLCSLFFQLLASSEVNNPLSTPHDPKKPNDHLS